MKIGDLIQTPKAAVGRGDGGGAAAGRPGGSTVALEQGALLQGRVVSAGSDGRVVLELAGQKVEARSSVPLTPGREFWFEVRRGGDEPRLALADKQGGVHRFLQQASGGLRDLSRLGDLLSALAKSATPAGQVGTTSAGAGPVTAANTGGDPTGLLPRLVLGSEPAPEKIVRLLAMLRGGESPEGARGGGERGAPLLARPGPAAARSPVLNLPGQLQALVAAASSQLQAAIGAGGEAGEAGSGRESLAALARVGGVLEAMVAMNEQPPPPNQAPFWLLPCFFALDAGAGSWLLSQGAAGEDGEDSTSLAFFLELSHLGELQLQVRVRGERLEGDFFLADPEAARFLRGRLGELRERLTALGYESVLRCRVGSEPLLPALKEALEKAAGSASRQLIDIKA